MKKKNIILYVIWLIIIAIGSILGTDVVPNNCKYITGFIFGCASMGILDIIYLTDRDNKDN